MDLPKKIHVIGISGIATSALAIGFHKAGVKVTGSDKGFFPPASTELEKAGISFYAGWHPEKMIEGGAPDLVVIPTASGSNNPETMYAMEHKMNCVGYTRVFADYFIKKNSIVCAGTWGKTSSSTLLSHILDYAGLNPSYMFGGVSLSHEAAARLTDSDWSVFEGDEYKSSPTDPTAKFFYYKPTHLLLSAVSWDHADLYPTEDSYFETFKKLVDGIPASGIIIANKDDRGVLRTLGGTGTAKSGAKIVWYGKSPADYTYESVKQSETGLSFTVKHAGVSYQIASTMLGAFQAENITACFAMAHSIGIVPGKIIEAIGSFKGLKRRLERRLDAKDSSSGITVFDDIAHSPEKAAAVLKELRQIYKGRIIAVFEPNIGGRRRESIAKYDGAFKSADMVVIPRLTKLKVADDEKELPIEGRELADTIAKTHPHAVCIEKDEDLVAILTSQAEKGDVIAFLGSHGFRGMIEQTVKELSE
jgi:UDP-N-acetylmuramate: L-alanyl-gamma-D-glutamyl-meso-diaminopimelate ligase